MSRPADAGSNAAFGERVRAYLLAHPEVILEAVQILQDRQQAAKTGEARKIIATRGDELFRDPASPVGGNPAGDVTLVEFFDYNCHYCRGVEPTLLQVQHADPGLRLVYKEFPILGPSSEVAARAALAARKQGKYQPLHDALMAAEQPLSDDKILATAAAVGIDVEQLKRDMADPAIEQEIRRNTELAAAVGIDGTPGFIIKDQVVPGALDRDALEGLIAKARKG